MSLFKCKKAPVDVPKYVDVPVVLEDGTTKMFPAGFVTNEDSVVVIRSIFHRHLDCPSVQDEVKTGHSVKAMTRVDAERQGLMFCNRCEAYDKEEDE